MRKCCCGVINLSALRSRPSAGHSLDAPKHTSKESWTTHSDHTYVCNIVTLSWVGVGVGEGAVATNAVAGTTAVHQTDPVQRPIRLCGSATRAAWHSLV
eukprot:22185-Chlamydomonas_euryale.AAC.1